MKQVISGCSIEEAMNLIGGRWRLLIVSYLFERPKRFSELRRDIPSISQRMLTMDLRALEAAGIVLRTVYPEVPVRVVYSLTSEGRRLEKVVDAVKELGLWLKTRPAETRSEHHD
ncbi:helix-turn-helix domain-containing protein [Serratia sp. AKBS12]|uniref:winged helix-turn-helix transcriptional regulator n=1 Tax=Serratia sp. AKBS12 TaxID=2974597 RepID=UPI0021669DA5|nr:helix-turn-helix domain-containing protein [Serratia sp. AKBS12]MCS3408535.1 helix-turn-helix transcriptional regulator [Serratia sp. AKBS12]